MKKQQHYKKRKRTLKIFGKKTNILLFLLFVVGCLLVGFFGVKLLLIFIAQPVLSVYNAAFNFYAITNNPVYFETASAFTKSYLQTIIFVILGAMVLFFTKLIRNKIKENEF